MVYGARRLMTYTPYAAPLGMSVYNKPAYKAGGTRTYTQTRTKRKTARNQVKQIMMSALPGKEFSQHVTRNFGHTLPYTLNVTGAVGQGTTNSTRIGDSVELQALKLSGAYTSAVAAGAYTFRIMVGFSGEEYGSTGAFLAGLTNAELFLPNTNPVFGTTGIVNPKAFTVLYDQTFNVNSQIAGVADVISFSETISLKQKFLYQQAGSIYGKVKNLYIVALGDIAGGSPGISNAGDLVLAMDLIFK